MIKIEEKKSSKLPLNTSLFVSFDYNAEIVNIVKSCEVANYDKKNTTWEVPVTELSKLLDRLCILDDISLKLTKCKKEKKPQDVVLNNHKTPLYKHQEEGIKYGLQNDKWLLLDSPGLGKTLQITYLAEELKQRENIEHCLIICGINTLKTNWKKEIELHSNLSCMILGGKINKKGNYVVGSVKDRIEDLKKPIDEFFVITNIESLRDKDLIKELSKNKINKFDMIVYDEIHTAKNPAAAQTKGLMKLKAKYMVGATGTILTNNPTDLYIPLKWIGVEDSTFTNFKYYFCNYTGQFNNILTGYKHIDLLKEELDECSLRRTKDLLDLPEKNIIHEFIDMNDTQRIFYSNIVNGIVEQVDKVHMSTSSILGMVARLRQATACPTYLTTENIKSSKVDRAIDLTKQIVANGEKVVIFSVFKETLNVLNEELKEYNPLLCTGDVKDEIISQNIDNFQTKDDCKIILATTSKMGTGITLTAASYAIFIDAPWTQAQCLQCEDRVHRIGSNKSVFIYYLWCNDSVDTKVKEIVETKGMLSDFIVDDECPPQLTDRLRQIILDL